MENQDYETIDLLEVLGILRRHIAVLLLCALAAAVAGFAVSRYIMTPQYQATALMIVNTRQDQNATVTNDQITSAKNLVGTYSIIVKSDTVLQQVIDALGLTLSYQDLSNKVSVSAVDSTQVMRVAVTDADAELARKICEQITLVAPGVIIDSVEAGSVKVISQAAILPGQVSPSVGRNTAIAGVLGLVLCLGVVFVRELLDNKINDEEDVKKYLDITVIGVIPHYDEGGRK